MYRTAIYCGVDTGLDIADSSYLKMGFVDVLTATVRVAMGKAS